MLKLDEALADENDRPLHPPKMRKTEILINPFSNIIPRIIVQESEEVKDSLETKTAGVKDFNLLSFGEEAKEDEEESVILNKKFSGEDKSAHDHLSDSKLSSQPAVEPPGFANKKERKTAVVIRKVSTKAMKIRIRNKLRDIEKKPKKVESYKIDDVEDDDDIKENK
ncbi:Peptidyl-prolyl cis-trans isomerase CWC27 like protein [Eufriesea mexicana]|uniref:Peptidyl-prolyl cis-trans isomerase CWC27 like protein n=1 Tax=Eufriesea mexicana TaxID=516756 RepID=A0A310SC75_9HYME|nr:Peptidyl-prolyl cis-trans isomerase CWC27 like protein [Eufriesea mexicana]